MKGYWQKGNLLGLKSIDFCKSLAAKVSYVLNEIWSERERKKKAHHPRETACKNKKTTWDSSWLVGNPASGPQSNSGTVKENLQQSSDIQSVQTGYLLLLLTEPVLHGCFC